MMKTLLTLILAFVPAFAFLVPSTAEARSERSSSYRSHSRHHDHGRYDKHRHYRSHRTSHKVYKRGYYKYTRGHRVWVPARYVVVYY